MTIEEYDSKAWIRERISEIDRCLQDFQDIEKYKDVPEMWHFEGVGTVSYFTAWPNRLSNPVKDTVLAERFKKLLIERKQELLNEFM